MSSTVTIPLSTFDDMRRKIQRLEDDIREINEKGGLSSMEYKLQRAKADYEDLNKRNYDYRTELQAIKDQLEEANKRSLMFKEDYKRILKRNIIQRIFNTK